jgi:hypothetical protein
LGRGALRSNTGNTDAYQTRQEESGWASHVVSPGLNSG